MITDWARKFITLFTPIVNTGMKYPGAIILLIPYEIMERSMDLQPILTSRYIKHMSRSPIE